MQQLFFWDGSCCGFQVVWQPRIVGWKWELLVLSAEEQSTWEGGVWPAPAVVGNPLPVAFGWIFRGSRWHRGTQSGKFAVDSADFRYHFLHFCTQLLIRKVLRRTAEIAPESFCLLRVPVLFPDSYQPLRCHKSCFGRWRHCSGLWRCAVAWTVMVRFLGGKSSPSPICSKVNR